MFFLPLRGEDAVEQGVRGTAALWWLQGEHVLENVEGKLFMRLTEKRSFGEGRPLLLQSALTPEVALWWDIEDIRQCGERQKKEAEENR